MPFPPNSFRPGSPTPPLTINKNPATNNLTNSSIKANKNKLSTQQSLSSSGTDGSKTDLINLNLKFRSNEITTMSMSSSQHQPQQTTSMGVTFDFAYSSSGSSTPYSHQVTSMNESKAKQVCKKRAIDVIW